MAAGSKLDELRNLAESVSVNKSTGNSEVLIKNDDDRDIITKTDLTNKQVRAVTTIGVLAEMTGNHLYDKLVNTFMNAQVSLKRQSRREFISNNQSIRTGEEAKAAASDSWWSQKV